MSREDEPNDFEPCVIVIQRDPAVIGRERLFPVAHRYGQDLADHIEERNLREFVGVVPYRTALFMQDVESDHFYEQEAVVICDDCFETVGAEK